MNFNIYDRLKESNYSDGKFLSDKSYAYDTVFFISKFIKDYSEDGIFDYSKWKVALEDYIAEKWQLLDKNDGIINYYHETINLLEYSHVIEKDGKNVKIIDPNIINFITKDNKMENAYIYIYLLCYFTVKNSGCLQSYIDFCNSNLDTEKQQHINEIYKCLCSVNSSVKDPNIHDQWAKQNTQYIMNVLNFINRQPWVTRDLTFNYGRVYNPEMISVNVKGTKTKYPKKNDYLKEFDFTYVINNLKGFLIEKGVE